ncbi:MerR family transcriptional regulator [Dictyobacter arantiisoli]|uniref:HTH merR-type domain-containing protein n=1 Tax=Dictyobacter arantiisoli TaxID=2014874 RepID=A0A5A5TID1_9CHLR|nr:MerR family transcriptional regulator [Dictyobacter arantiisoli]GCF10975.1 hypothetical protein KDI_45390 [Dictyobacter arantiisoli]
MDQGYYQTGQFARKAAVTVRTLRFYDKVGLLSPQQHTASGHRLYSEQDFFCLQQILALKMLGFSLAEIKTCLQTEPQQLQQVLAIQKQMLYERRAQLETIIQAVNQAESRMQNKQPIWESIVSVIQVIQMQQNSDWHEKYFTKEQLEKMQQISEQAYTSEQRQQIADWGQGWSEEDQKQADQQWQAVNSELHQLVATGADPASAEAQKWVAAYRTLIAQFTHGDMAIESGLKKYYKTLEQLPEQEQPLKLPYNAEESAFIARAVAIHQQGQEAQ